MSDILKFEPKLVWKYFNEICKIPHGSKNEEAIGNYTMKVAKEFGCEAVKDKLGSILIKVPGTKGHEKAPILVLQGHLDMVCEKNKDVQHDFEKDPIKLIVKDNKILTADGTTLGADNGIAIAICLALVEDKTIEHGPLELLFTIDEETGLTGAFGLTSDFVKGRTYINLDTEEWGAIYVGSAGGGDSQTHLSFTKEKYPSDHSSIKIEVTGLKGGHSGVDVSLERANAVKLLGRVLLKVYEKYPFYIQNTHGGHVRNAIPRESFAEIVVNTKDLDNVKKIIKEQEAITQFEYKTVDPGLKYVIESAGSSEKVVSKEATLKMLQLIHALPNGIINWSKDIPGLVETSTNLGVLEMHEDNFELISCTRSSVSTALYYVRDCIKATATLAGATVHEPEAYPGWKPNLESKILNLTKQVYKKLFNIDPETKAIHAGLECGIIGEKFPGMDTISIGPEIRFPHSPDENTEIETVEKLWKLLKQVLIDFAKQ